MNGALQGSDLDSHAKQWRLFADCFNNVGRCEMELPYHLSVGGLWIVYQDEVEVQPGSSAQLCESELAIFRHLTMFCCTPCLNHVIM